MVGIGVAQVKLGLFSVSAKALVCKMKKKNKQANKLNSSQFYLLNKILSFKLYSNTLKDWKKGAFHLNSKEIYVLSKIFCTVCFLTFHQYWKAEGLTIMKEFTTVWNPGTFNLLLFYSCFSCFGETHLNTT